MKFRVRDTKDARIDLRLRKEDKRQFYKICDQYGLCPSDVLERWIRRFVLNTKSLKQCYTGVVIHPRDEVFAELVDYKGYPNHGNLTVELTDEDVDDSTF